MATNNSVNVGLSGATGTGSFVGSTSPTFVSPNLGVATATSIAFNPSTGGIVGTTAADNATTGTVGELVTSHVASSPGVSLTNNTNTDVTSISLTAGDWDIYGNVNFKASGANITFCNAWTNNASVTRPDQSIRFSAGNAAGATTLGCAVPILRINVSTSATAYLSCAALFASGTCTASGSIFARRVR